MKLSSVILVAVAGVIAIVAGWVYQSRNQLTETRAELEIPVDIDYYLSGVKYRVMAKTGELNYELRSPYLQHFKRDDISRIDTPEIDIFRQNQHWQIEAKTAELIHPENILNLIDDVLVQKQGQKEMQLSTVHLRFEADNDLMIAEQAVQLTGKNTLINADRAVFELDQNRYTLTNTRAVYSNEES